MGKAVHIWGKKVPGKGNIRCRRPQVQACLSCLNTGEEQSELEEDQQEARYVFEGEVLSGKRQIEPWKSQLRSMVFTLNKMANLWRIFLIQMTCSDLHVNRVILTTILRSQRKQGDQLGALTKILFRNHGGSDLRDSSEKYSGLGYI